MELRTCVIIFLCPPSPPLSESENPPPLVPHSFGAIGNIIFFSRKRKRKRENQWRCYIISDDKGEKPRCVTCCPSSVEIKVTKGEKKVPTKNKKMTKTREFLSPARLFLSVSGRRSDVPGKKTLAHLFLPLINSRSKNAWKERRRKFDGTLQYTGAWYLPI